MHYFNTTTNKFDSNSLSYFYSMLTGWLKEEDGWLTMSTPVTLPDMSGVIKTELKIEGPPTIDFLVDNVALIIWNIVLIKVYHIKSLRYFLEAKVLNTYLNKSCI